MSRTTASLAKYYYMYSFKIISTLQICKYIKGFEDEVVHVPEHNFYTYVNAGVGNAKL